MNQLPPWIEMWALCALFFGVAKFLSLASAIPRLPTRPGRGRSAAFLLLWPGMDAIAFLGHRDQNRAPVSREWYWPCLRITLGAGVIWGFVREVQPHFPLAAGWLGMLGGVLCLHFGVFDLLSLGWRTLGIAAAPLMRAPHRAVSLSSFWGERWNHAFHILIANYIFRPVARRAGPAVALWAGFAVSGLVHDAVISVPARAGYGFPTLYFLVQALGIILERGRFVRSIDRDDNRRRHFLTLAWVAAPAGLLFTKPFVREVILPFLHALRAI